MIKIGVAHSALAQEDGGIPDPVAVARCVEETGLDSMWVSDHLTTGAPVLDSTLTLTAAAAATERIELGFGVLQLALRKVAWAAKQIGTLQHLSGDRVQLGIGVGGDAPEEWAASGVPRGERGRRTDEALRALRPLLAAEPTPLPDVDGAEVTLQPAVPMPGVWIGGGSQAALRRTAEIGDAWLPAAVTPEQLRAGLDRIGELGDAAGRPRPRAGVVVFAALEAHLGGTTHDGLVDFLAGNFGFPREQADRTVVSGPPDRIAARCAEYAEAGAEHLVVNPIGTDWKRQLDLLAAVRAAEAAA